MSPSPSAKSSSHNAQRAEDAKIEQNCKVYVSNINRDARDEEIREIFQKFGRIKYFQMKRKPEDVVYAFLEFNTYKEANEAVTNMDKTIFLKRPLNVQFGRGGKHQQKHYEKIPFPPIKNRYFNSRERQDRQRRSESKPDRYQNTRKSDKITRRGSRSPPGRYQKSKKYYRDERPRQGHIDGFRHQNQRERGFNHHESRRRDYDEKDYKKDEKRYQQKYSPERGSRRSYDDDDKQPERRYDDKKRIDERDRDNYRRKEKSNYEDSNRRDKYEDEGRRKSPYHYEKNKDRYAKQSHDKRQRHENDRSQSPRKDKYSRSHRDRDDQRRLYDHRYRNSDRRERDDYQRGRQRDRGNKRSRSREKSSQKQKYHRRDRYEQDSSRKQSHRYQRDHSRGRRSPRRDQDRNRRHSRSEDRKRKHSRSEDRKRRSSRSYSPYRVPNQRRYPEKNQPHNSSYRKYEYKRYPHPYVRNPRPYEEKKQASRGKGVETSIDYRKNSRASHQSKSRSPEKPRTIVEDSEKNVRFSSDKQISPRVNGNNQVQASIENQGEY